MKPQVNGVRDVWRMHGPGNHGYSSLSKEKRELVIRGSRILFTRDRDFRLNEAISVLVIHAPHVLWG